MCSGKVKERSRKDISMLAEPDREQQAGRVMDCRRGCAIEPAPSRPGGCVIGVPGRINGGGASRKRSVEAASPLPLLASACIIALLASGDASPIWRACQGRSMHIGRLSPISRHSLRYGGLGMSRTQAALRIRPTSREHAAPSMRWFARRQVAAQGCGGRHSLVPVAPFTSSLLLEATLLLRYSHHEGLTLSLCQYAAVEE